MKKKQYILAVLAVILVLCASIGAASAYFTTYADARGGYVVHMKYQTEIYEEFDGNTKVVKITNEPEQGTDPGTYPVFVRVKVYHGSDSSIDVQIPTDSDWSEVEAGVYYYLSPLYTGDSTDPPLRIGVEPVPGANIRDGDPVDVIVTYESVPAVFFPNGDPDPVTAWANDSLIQTIETR